MVEQQQFTATDNVGKQAQTAESAGISGQDRMELYKGFNETVGQSSNNEKSLTEQSLKGDKSDGELKFNNIYEQTSSLGGNGEKGLNTNQADGKASNGSEQSQDSQAEKGSDKKANGQREFNGRPDPYTKEALEAAGGKEQQDFSPGNEKGDRQGGNAGEKTHEGAEPGASRDSREQAGEAAQGDGTANGGDAQSEGDNRNGNVSGGDAQRQGTESSESGDAAQRQGNADAQRQIANPEATRGIKPGSPDQRSDSQNSLSDLSKQNAKQMMSASETVNESDEPGSPDQRSDSRNSLSDLSRQNANQMMSASETEEIEDGEEGDQGEQGQGQNNGFIHSGAPQQLDKIRRN